MLHGLLESCSKPTECCRASVEELEVFASGGMMSPSYVVGMHDHSQSLLRFRHDMPPLFIAPSLFLPKPFIDGIDSTNWLALDRSDCPYLPLSYTLLTS